MRCNIESTSFAINMNNIKFSLLLMTFINVKYLRLFESTVFENF